MRVPSGQSADCNSLQLKRPRHAGFTLIELLVAIAIISLLSAALLIALTELQAQSKLRRCQQQIKKIDQLIIQRWDEILHKPLPIQLSPLGATPTGQEIQARKLQVLIARRELLRLEMPERITDISDNPVVFPGGYVMPLPATTSTFRRKAVFNASQGNVWTEQYQGAECLYLILSVMQDQDSSALDFFFPGEIGDMDNDGMPEILDGFNQPIGFLRWAPGFSYRPGIHIPRHQSRYSDIQDINPIDSPDATDMGAADPRLYDDNARNDPYNLFPLIMSAGRDGQFGLIGIPDEDPDPSFNGVSYHSLSNPNDPFYSVFTETDSTLILGSPVNDMAIDNISNHQIEVNQ